ncbi:MAG: formylglycine-generating enzyme family protein [Alistipes sp.]|nr:formylglycine-generating enzyme family protein [Alistipes sp.]
MRNNWYLVFLCVAMFVPYIATAQMFEKQKVAVWEVFDNNYGATVNSATKIEIKAKMTDALTRSRNYDALECNTDDVKQYITAKGWQMSPKNIARAVREKYGVNYVIFTEIKILERGASQDRHKVHITSEFYMTEIQKSERMAYVDMISGDSNLIPIKAAELISDLLQENISASSSSSSSGSSSGYQSVSNVNQYYVENAGCGLNMKMIYVEGGTFQMGATPEQGSHAASDDRPVHSVTLDGYYIAECEVTQEQWQKIMGTTIYQQRDKANTMWTRAIEGNGPNYPMYFVSWHEAQKFCGILSEITGKTYMLPTEAQWEYAARGGNKSKGYKYSGSAYVEAVAWYDSNSGETSHPVKGKRANELGLYDMSGNVYEWCYDWKGAYSSSSQSNPTGASLGENRVMRGGCWCAIADFCRVSFRDAYDPPYRESIIGFRVVCIP